VHLFEQQALHGAPVLEGVQPLEGDRGRQPEAGRQAQAVFVEHGLDVMMSTGPNFSMAFLTTSRSPSVADISALDRYIRSVLGEPQFP
jgi:hypothetical protein